MAPLHHRSGFLGNSAGAVSIRQLLEKVAQSNATVLINGESGTGKELVAQSLHTHGPRAHGPFVPINCGAIPKDLFESELFGYEKGAFTGALDKGKMGKVEAAEKGTLFLDEIGDLHFSLQAKLLRVFQEQKIRAVGDNKFRSVNVRIITATHKNLAEEIRNQRFREDLYYRLNAITISTIISISTVLLRSTSRIPLNRIVKMGRPVRSERLGSAMKRNMIPIKNS